VEKPLQEPAAAAVAIAKRRERVLSHLAEQPEESDSMTASPVRPRRTMRLASSPSARNRDALSGSRCRCPALFGNGTRSLDSFPCSDYSVSEMLQPPPRSPRGRSGGEQFPDQRSWQGRRLHPPDRTLIVDNRIGTRKIHADKPISSASAEGGVRQSIVFASRTKLVEPVADGVR